jgi:hypothetical protein
MVNLEKKSPKHFLWTLCYAKGISADCKQKGNMLAVACDSGYGL